MQIMMINSYFDWFIIRLVLGGCNYILQENFPFILNKEKNRYLSTDSTKKYQPQPRMQILVSE